MKRVLKAFGLAVGSLATALAVIAVMAVIPPWLLAIIVGLLVAGLLTALFYQVVS